ncbi:MAG: pyrroline-5-carboxylate reductase [Clostridia bacterium]|nr:pyrroline-5-carboxylate reductase [Clostridia bacterium]
MKTAVLGSGKMGSAMIRGMLRARLCEPGELTVTNRSGRLPEALCEWAGLRCIRDNREAARDADYVILAVLPQQLPAVLAEIRDALRPEACLISIAPGYTVGQLSAMIGQACPVVRAMPNTPAMIGEGMTAVCRNDAVDEARLEGTIRLLSALGKTELIEESQLNAFIGVCGSAPAYFYMFLDALADAGVLEGLHRDQAIRFAAQAMLGSARLQQETGEAPSVLKDMVCSPGGTTIEAVAALENAGLRGAVITGARAAAQKAAQMGKK